VSLALIVTIALMIGTRVIEQRADLARASAATSDFIAAALAPMLREQRYDAAQHLVQSGGKLLRANAWWLFMTNGTLIGRSPRAVDVPLASLRARESDHRASDSAPLFITPIVDGATTIGYIVVEPAVSSPLSGLETTIAVALVGLIAGVGIALLAGISMHRSLLEPLVAMARLSREITRGKGTILSRRLARSANNEIGDVAEGFNYLVDQIELRDKAMRRRRVDVARVLESRRELQYDKAMAQAERRQKAAFLALVCNEMRLPLANLVDAIAELGAAGVPQHRALLIARARTEHLLQMAADIAILSGPKTPSSEEKATFRIREMLESVTEAFADHALASNADILWHSDIDVPRTIRGDYIGIRRLLSTLVANAVNGTESGHSVIVVCSLHDTERRAAAGAIRIKFEVISVGPGVLEAIGSKAAASAMDPLNPDVAKLGAAGLAMAIAKQQAEGLGGQLSYALIPGAGSTSSATISVQCDDSDMTAEPTFSHHASVLLFESSRVMREMLKRRLESVGLAVTAALSIERTCQLLAEGTRNHRPYDCLFVSAKGNEFDNLLRAFTATPTIERTLLVVLARRGVVVPDAVFELGGGVTILRTPFRDAELLRAVEYIGESPGGLDAATRTVPLPTPEMEPDPRTTPRRDGLPGANTSGTPRGRNITLIDRKAN
jgi:signal transduction histidine kinase